ncbi:YigZ family protein [Clostridia bacterium]|nr:YigZ family protein [Clostridia bacterium]
MFTINGVFAAEYEVKRSRFIGTICGVNNKQDAVSFIKAVRTEFKDATHNVYALILQDENLQKSSDDHEPKGTAGLPVLGVLQNNELTNVVAVVTRYFGGILLGAGGLVRAYSKTVQLALKNADVIPVKYYIGIEIILDYSLYSAVTFLFSSYDIILRKTVFFEKIHISLSVLESHVNDFKAAVFNVCSGNVTWYNEKS